MPFVVQCPYCKIRARVPDRARGESGKCTRCAGSFTLVPAEDQRIPETAAVAVEPSRTDVEPKAAPVSAALAGRDDEEVAAHAELMAQFDAAPMDEGVSKSMANGVVADTDTVASPGKHMQPDAVFGASALLMSGAGLVCASVPPACFLLLPLGGLGLMSGVAALVLTRRAKTGHRVLPICGLVAPVVLLLAAFLFPGVLGPDYRQWRLTSGEAPPDLRAIPLAGVTVAGPPEWADASKYALKRGDLRLEVVKVWLGPPLTVPEGKRDLPKDVLLVRLSVKRMQMPELVGREVSIFERSDQSRATIVDDARRSYEFQDNRVVGPAGGSRRSSPFPVSTVEEVLAFEVPPADVKFLKLELPGVETIGAGTFRFTIPAAMIVRPEPAEGGQ